MNNKCVSYRRANCDGVCDQGECQAQSTKCKRYECDGNQCVVKEQCDEGDLCLPDACPSTDPCVPHVCAGDKGERKCVPKPVQCAPAMMTRARWTSAWPRWWTGASVPCA